MEAGAAAIGASPQDIVRVVGAEDRPRGLHEIEREAAVLKSTAAERRAELQGVARTHQRVRAGPGAVYGQDAIGHDDRAAARRPTRPTHRQTAAGELRTGGRR